MSNNVCIENNPVLIEPTSSVSLTGTEDVPICVEQNLEVTASKNEYSVVGDALYASIDVNEAPEWLTAIIDSIIDVQLSGSLSDLDDLRGAILTSLDELEIAKNQYEELINIEETIDGIITSRLTTLNASMAQANANIINLQLTSVTASGASAIAAEVISSSLNGGAIGSAIETVNMTVTTLDETVANMYTVLTSAIDGVGEATSEVEVLANVLKDRLEASWSYNAKLLLADGKWYRSGFGLNTSVQVGGDGSEANPYNSEFWINAQRFKFTNSGMTGTVTPFTIDASGTTPEITFTGNVVISNRDTAVGGGIPIFLGRFPSPPAAQVKGDTYQSTINEIIYQWNGVSWVSTAGADGQDGQDGAQGPPGTPGSNGTNGIRGAGFFRVGTASGAWSDSVANSAVPTGIPVPNDVVTIYQNSNPTNATTRMYTGAAWVAPALAVHGNMVVDGTVVASKLVTGSITGTYLANSTIPSTKFVGLLDSDTIDLGTGQPMMRLNFRTGDAWLRNVYARGDIEASSLKAGNVFVGNTIQSNNFNPANPTQSGWQINANGAAYFNGVVVTRPNVVASGTLNIGGATAITAHFGNFRNVLYPLSSTQFVSRFNQPTYAQDSDNILYEATPSGLGFGAGGYYEFIVDIPTSTFSPDEVGVVNGRMLAAQAVVVDSEYFYTGAAPEYGYKTPCEAAVTRVANYGASGSYIQVKIKVYVPFDKHPRINGIQIRSINWALSAFT